MQIIGYAPLVCAYRLLYMPYLDNITNLDDIESDDALENRPGTDVAASNHRYHRVRSEYRPDIYDTAYDDALIDPGIYSPHGPGIRDAYGYHAPRTLLGTYFLANIGTHLKLLLPGSTSLENMYVVVQKEQIFFYSPGMMYYSFGLKEDGIVVKLMPTNVPWKVEHFSKDTLPTKPKKVLKWEDLVKQNSARTKDGHQQEGAVKKTTTREISVPSGRKRIFGFEDSQADAHDIIRSADNDYIAASRHAKYGLDAPGLPRKQHAIHEESHIVEPPEAGLAAARPRDMLIDNILSLVKDAHNDAVAEKLQADHILTAHHDIESDSDMVFKANLDMKIQMVSREKKTFRLATRNNLCLTLFKRTFILTECSQINNQIFKLIDANDVTRELKARGEERHAALLHDAIRADKLAWAANGPALETERLTEGTLPGVVGAPLYRDLTDVNSHDAQATNEHIRRMQLESINRQFDRLHNKHIDPLYPVPGLVKPMATSAVVMPPKAAAVSDLPPLIKALPAQHPFDSVAGSPISFSHQHPDELGTHPKPLMVAKQPSLTERIEKALEDDHFFR